MAAKRKRFNGNYSEDDTCSLYCPCGNDHLFVGGGPTMCTCGRVYKTEFIVWVTEPEDKIKTEAISVLQKMEEDNLKNMHKFPQGLR